ncbi:MAG: cell division protein FtsQ/DivIB [Pseudomonadota bacterium]
MRPLGEVMGRLHAAVNPEPPVGDGAPRRRRRRTGPGPSKLAYRLRRTWAQPAVRAAVTLYLPVTLAALLAWRGIADDGLRQAAEARITAAWDAVKARPEFALEGIVITGVPDRLRAEVHRMLALPATQSSLSLDLEALRARVEAMGGVASAELRLDTAGVLHLDLVPRPAVALWRDPAAGGALFRIAVDGTVIAAVARRAAFPDLPVLIGEGADAAVGEAMALIALGREIDARLRALVRVGARRWDIVLAGEDALSAEDIRVMLPSADPEAAWARVLALHYGSDLLNRDVAAVDMRLPDRPTLRLHSRAIETMRLRRMLDEAEKEAL